MAGLLDFFSGGSDADLYGGLLNEAQRRALTTRGLASMAEKFGQLAMPQRAPIPLGAVLGQGFGAYGAGTDEALKTAFEAQYKAAQAQKLQSEIDYAKTIGPALDEFGKTQRGLLGMAGGGAAMPGSGSTGGAAVSPGGGGDVGSLSDPRGMVPHITAEATRLGIDVPTALKVAKSEGLGTFSGDGGKSGGAFQLYTGGGMGNDFQRDTGLDPLDPKNEKATITYALEQAAKNGWGAWNGAKKLGITGFAGIGKPGAAPSAAAPAAPDISPVPRTGYFHPVPAGGGGLLPAFTTGRAGLLGGATADAGDTSPPADVAPNRVGRFAGVAPGTPVNSGGFPYNPEITDPAVAARVAQSMAAIKQAQQSGVPWAAPRESSGSSTGAPGQGAALEEPPGFAGRQLVAQLGTGAPLSDVGQYQQVAGPGGGDTSPAMATGLLAPGGPLTRGVANMPAMPAAPTPANDPGLQLGPLAPAPAAAAPATAGPGLLSPQGAAAALPQVNPGYDAIARQIAGLRVRARLAGLPDVFEALQSGLTSSPAYQAQLELAKRLGVFPLIGPEAAARTTAERGAAEPFDIRASERALGNALTEKGWRLGPDGQAVRIPGYDAMTEATALATARGTAEGGMPTTLIIKSVENQNKIIADAAANGNQVTFDKDGRMSVSRLPGADAAAQAAAAAQARGTGSVEPTTVLRQGPNGPYEAPSTKTSAADELNRQQMAGVPGGGVAAPGTNPPLGSIVGKPYQTPEEIASQASDQKRLDTMQATAQASRLAIQNANDLRQLIENGAILGPGADTRTQLLKLGQLLKLTGKNDNDLIANTETFIARQGAELKTALQGLGPPVSDRDLGVAANIAGNQNLTPQGLLQLMQIKEKYHRQALSDYNQIAEKAPPSRYPRLVNEPPTYGAKTATGPNGQRMWEKSPNNWVPF